MNHGITYNIERLCHFCGDKKLLKDFKILQKKKNGARYYDFDSYCAVCRKEYNKWYQMNKAVKNYYYER